jgi:purine/pyrimidine-nucleoside phosphorylase
MDIIDGELDVQLPGSDQWQSIKGGDSFNVPAQSKFTVKIITPTDYCCSFLK